MDHRRTRKGKGTRGSGCARTANTPAMQSTGSEGESYDDDSYSSESDHGEPTAAQKPHVILEKGPLVCLLCDFQDNTLATILQHLLTQHKFVIADVECVASMQRYHIHHPHCSNSLQLPCILETKDQHQSNPRVYFHNSNPNSYWYASTHTSLSGSGCTYICAYTTLIIFTCHTHTQYAHRIHRARLLLFAEWYSAWRQGNKRKVKKEEAGTLEHLPTYLPFPTYLPLPSCLQVELIEIQQQERSDQNFHRKCLFCKDVIYGRYAHTFMQTTTATTKVSNK